MHIGEALMPRPDAIERARAGLLETMARNEMYYAKRPGSRPVPANVLEDRISADDTWIYIPFGREDASAKPIVVRVNGVTKSVSIEQAF